MVTEFAGIRLGDLVRSEHMESHTFGLVTGFVCDSVGPYGILVAWYSPGQEPWMSSGTWYPLELEVVSPCSDGTP